MKHKFYRGVLALTLMGAILTGCGGETPNSGEKDTKIFTDSLGREVTLPADVEKIAVTGPLSQTYVLPLGGDMMVGVSNAFSEDAELYFPDYIMEMTEIGQLYGGKGEMDLEALLSADPDVVIDVGEAKSGMKEDLDTLTKQTGIPFVHIDATIATADECYRMLGDLLGREKQAEELASWCEETYDSTIAMMEQVDADNARKSMLYCLGDTGTNVMALGSFHAETVNLMSKNLAVIDEVVSSGAGNEVDMEQILVWNPEYLIFDQNSVYAQVKDSAQWQQLDAVKNGTYYETPYGPYGWLSSPPAVQRYLGILWLGELLYPNYVEYDLQEEVTEYYKLFYKCELTADMYEDLMEFSK